MNITDVPLTDGSGREEDKIAPLEQVNSALFVGFDNLAEYGGNIRHMFPHSIRLLSPSKCVVGAIPKSPFPTTLTSTPPPRAAPPALSKVDRAYSRQVRHDVSGVIDHERARAGCCRVTLTPRATIAVQPPVRPLLLRDFILSVPVGEQALT